MTLAITLFSGFLVSYLQLTRSEEVEFTGTLFCGVDSGLVEMDGDRDLWLINASITSTFAVDACGSYDYGGYVNMRFDMYEYSGTGGSSVYDRELTYLGYNTYFSWWSYSDISDENDAYVDDYSCDSWDPRYSIEEDAFGLYVLNVSEYSWWGSAAYEDSYYVRMSCDDIVAVQGTLECDEEVTGTFWDQTHYWYVDPSSASDSFSVSTCGSYGDYGADTFIRVYGYKDESSGTYASTREFSRPMDINDDDQNGFCDEDARFIPDSYSVITNLDYDVYVIEIEDYWDSGETYYDLTVECDSLSSDAFTSSSSSSSISTGMLIMIIVLPLLFLAAAFYIYRQKDGQQQQPMMMGSMQPMIGGQMQPMQMGPIQTGPMQQPMVTLPDQPAVGGTAGAGSAGQSAGQEPAEGVDAMAGGTQVVDGMSPN